MKHRACLVALFTIFTAFSHSAVGIEKWVDEAGNVHYGDRPPVGTEGKNIHVDSAPRDIGNIANLNNRLKTKSNNGLRYGERKRLSAAEYQDKSDKIYKEVIANSDRRYQERTKLRDKQYRCRDLESKYNSGRHNKADIIGQQRRAGCQ